MFGKHPDGYKLPVLGWVGSILLRGDGLPGQKGHLWAATNQPAAVAEPPPPT